MSWQLHLVSQLGRLCDEHRRPLNDASPRADLARQVATRLVEVGFDLHDCAGRSGGQALGGARLSAGYASSLLTLA